MTINQKIKELRERLGLSQESMGNLLYITQAHYSRLERGESMPTSKMCVSLYLLSADHCFLDWIVSSLLTEIIEQISAAQPRIKFA